MLQHLLIILLG